MLKVALTGAHGTGKTWIIDRLKLMGESAGFVVEVIESPTRYVKSLGFGLNKQLDFHTEWMCMAKRVERQRLAERKLSNIEVEGHAHKLPPSFDKTLLLADRCLLDELSYTRQAIEAARGPEWEIIKAFDPVTNPGPKVPPQIPFDPAYQLARFYDVAYDFVYEDVTSFWDKVYYKPIHPDFLPEADGDRIDDQVYQASVDESIQFHWRDLDIKDNYRNLAQLCDRDRTVAVEEIWNDIEEELSVEQSG